jgi:hypothetical protein
MKILKAIACAAAIMLGVSGLGQAQAARALNLNHLSAEISAPGKYVHKATYYDCPPYYGYSYYPYRRGYYPYRRHYGYYGQRHYYPYRRHYGHYGHYGRRHYGYGHRRHHRRHY